MKLVHSQKDAGGNTHERLRLAMQDVQANLYEFSLEQMYSSVLTDVEVISIEEHKIFSIPTPSLEASPEHTQRNWLKVTSPEKQNRSSIKQLNPHMKK